MRKKNFFSTILSLLILIALIACGYIFFKDMDGPSIAIEPDTGRVSPHTPLQITLADPSNIRSISVGVRRNNVVTPIFQRHFEEYLPQRTVEVSLKNAGLREGAFELEIKATDASLAGFGQGNTRTEVLAMRLDTQPPRISVKTLPPSVRRGGAAAIRCQGLSDIAAIKGRCDVPVIGLWGAVVSLGTVQGLTLLLSLLVLRRSGCIARSR